MLIKVYIFQGIYISPSEITGITENSHIPDYVIYIHDPITCKKEDELYRKIIDELYNTNPLSSLNVFSLEPQDEDNVRNALHWIISKIMVKLNITCADMMVNLVMGDNNKDV